MKFTLNQTISTGSTFVVIFYCGVFSPIRGVAQQLRLLCVRAFHLVLNSISLYLLTNPLLSIVFCEAMFFMAQPQLGFILLFMAKDRNFNIICEPNLCLRFNGYLHCLFVVQKNQSLLSLFLRTILEIQVMS